MDDRTAKLRQALQVKISEIDELEKTIDRERCHTFYASTSMLLEQLLNQDSHELTEFRRLDGESAVISADPHRNEQANEEAYYGDLKRARSILAAVAESLDWRTPNPSADGVGTQATPANNDEVKQAVLDHLYEMRQQQPHRERGYSAKEIMHHLPQYPAAEVRTAIEFLDDEGLLKHTTDRSIKFYRLGSKALDRFQPSEFKNRPLSSIQIHNMSGIMVNGDNVGTITQNNTEGIQDIDKLIEALKASSASQDDKREIVADLETIKTQLLKKQPNGGIIKTAWGAVKTGVSAAPTITAASGYIERIGHFLSAWL